MTQRQWRTNERISSLPSAAAADFPENRQEHHDEERPEGGDFGDVAQGMNGDGVHSGLLDHVRFMLCSFLVPVNSTGAVRRPKRERLVNEMGQP